MEIQDLRFEEEVPKPRVEKPRDYEKRTYLPFSVEKGELEKVAVAWGLGSLYAACKRQADAGVKGAYRPVMKALKKRFLLVTSLLAQGKLKVQKS